VSVRVGRRIAIRELIGSSMVSSGIGDGDKTDCLRLDCTMGRVILTIGGWKSGSGSTSRTLALRVGWRVGVREVEGSSSGDSSGATSNDDEEQDDVASSDVLTSGGCTSDSSISGNFAGSTSSSRSLGTGEMNEKVLPVCFVGCRLTKEGSRSVIARLISGGNSSS
jgi:hypothetical protein